MRNIFIFTLFVSLLSVPSWGETLSINDLGKFKNTYYKKKSSTPFTGSVVGVQNGMIKNGKREGNWFSRYPNGVIGFKVFFKDGLEEGLKITYHKNGNKKTQEKYKKGKREGLYLIYNFDGRLERIEVYRDDLLVDSEDIKID